MFDIKLYTTRFSFFVAFLCQLLFVFRFLFFPCVTRKLNLYVRYIRICETGTHSVSIQYIIDVTSTKMIEYNHVFTKIMIFFPMLVLYVLRRRRETRFSFVLYPLWSFRVCLERQISDIRCVRND